MERVYITKNKKTIAVEVRDDEYKAQKSKTAGIMRYLDQIEREKQAKQAKLKTCPDCHMTCTPSGFCIRCGRDCREDSYKKPVTKHITDRDVEFTAIKVVIKK